MRNVMIAGSVFLLLAFVIIFYSEFRTLNFVDSFLSNPDELAEKVHRVTIWGEGADGSVETLATFNLGDEKFDEALAAISEWEVKRVLFKDMDSTQKMYKLDIGIHANPINPYNLNISSDGMMNIHGKEYELVSGRSIEEIIDIMK